MSRLFLISNRLPISVTSDRHKLNITLSSGGVATGLRCFHDLTDSRWLGWPGIHQPHDESQRQDLADKLREWRTVPLYLSNKEVHEYYEGFANGVLWPLFHYLLDKVRLDAAKDWKTYCQVNQRYADLILAQDKIEEGIIWIHDYQLLLVPQMVREKLPGARIGFFLHIPFPSMEIFRLLPWREALINGMLGADLVGFHTESYMKNFLESIHKIIGIKPQGHTVRFAARTINAGVFPMGIDAEKFSRLAATPEVDEEMARIKTEYHNRKLVLSVDRLDYTKGITHRLFAIEKLLKQTSLRKMNFRFLQIAVPSRTAVESYARFRREIEEMVGRINGAHGHINVVPIHYVFRSVSETQLTALYRAADILLINSLRDGMNLVAKEYAAARIDNDGVLVLSELAGASDELSAALIVNPHDIDGVAATIKRALAMPKNERQERMQQLRHQVFAHNIYRWGTEFISSLMKPTASTNAQDIPLLSSSELLTDVRNRIKTAEFLHLLLDYDGTLVPFADTPQEASPGAELLSLLSSLSSRPRTHVHIVSGRSYQSLGEWLGHLAITLHAEHGYWTRPAGSTKWIANHSRSSNWKDAVRALMQKATREQPESLLEEKESALAWHYRLVPSPHGAALAEKLLQQLKDIQSDTAWEILRGNQVVETRLVGVHKGNIVAQAMANQPSGLIVAIGDDKTDEDLFCALPSGHIAIHVGSQPSSARYRIADHGAVRDLLKKIV